MCSGRGAGVSAALIQGDAETAPGWLALLLYLIPAAVALVMVGILIRRRWRRRRGAEEGERE